jgi:hypothetical protein
MAIQRLPIRVPHPEYVSLCLSSEMRSKHGWYLNSSTTASDVVRHSELTSQKDGPLMDLLCAVFQVSTGSPVSTEKTAYNLIVTLLPFFFLSRYLIT